MTLISRDEYRQRQGYISFGAIEDDENHQWAAKEEKKMQTSLMFFKWCAKNVFKMLNYCYHLKAWKLYKPQTENGRDNIESQICGFSLF